MRKHEAERREKIGQEKPRCSGSECKLSGADAAGAQVTFTLNSPNFQPDTWETGSPKIIPLNSVRIGKGTFFE